MRVKLKQGSLGDEQQENHKKIYYGKNYTYLKNASKRLTDSKL
jgi:hypothetical protein